ncbi:MAG TPA: hypothetical protein VN519_04420 [Bryobacteraceae bacterium]|nr:hypothetical protein [Bryobacteraceae bacterium]
MADSPLIEAAKRWVIGKYTYNNFHLVRALEWLDRLAPGSSEAARLATLTHDMERAFPGPDQPVMTALDDPAYMVLHSERSARIVGAWLRENGADEDLARGVERLIEFHEFGGWPEANLVQAADSLSFLDVNVDLFLNMARSGKRTIRDVRNKFDYSYDRIQVPEAKALALPMLEKANEKLAALEAELAGAARQ